MPGVDPVDADAVRWDRYGWSVDLDVLSVPNVVVISIDVDAQAGARERLMWPVPPAAALSLALMLREGWTPGGLDFSEHGGPRVTVESLAHANGCTLIFAVDGEASAVVLTPQDALKIADCLNDAAIWSELDDPASRSQWKSIADALAFALLAAGAFGLSAGFVGAALNSLLVDASLEASRG